MASRSEETKTLVAHKKNYLKEKRMELSELSFLYFEHGGNIIIAGEDQDVTDEVREFIQKNGLRPEDEFLPNFLSFDGGSIVVIYIDGTNVTEECHNWLAEKSISDKE